VSDVIADTVAFTETVVGVLGNAISVFHIYFFNKHREIYKTAPAMSSMLGDYRGDIRSSPSAKVRLQPENDTLPEIIISKNAK
jgi:hypothetical protein